MPNTTGFVVRTEAFSDDGPARFDFTLPDGTTEEQIPLSPALKKVSELTGFPAHKAREVLRAACLTGNAHIGGVILEPSEGGGMAVLCRHRHLIEYVRANEWPGSAREARYTDRAYLNICHGRLGEEAQP